MNEIGKRQHTIVQITKRNLNKISKASLYLLSEKENEDSFNLFKKTTFLVYTVDMTYKHDENKQKTNAKYISIQISSALISKLCSTCMYSKISTS